MCSRRRCRFFSGHMDGRPVVRGSPPRGHASRWRPRRCSWRGHSSPACKVERRGGGGQKTGPPPAGCFCIYFVVAVRLEERRRLSSLPGINLSVLERRRGEALSTAAAPSRPQVTDDGLPQRGTIQQMRRCSMHERGLVVSAKCGERSQPCRGRLRFRNQLSTTQLI